MNQSGAQTQEERKIKMDQKTNALKKSSKVISVIMKIGYTVMIVALCITVAAMLFLAISGGETSVALSNETNLIIADGLPESTGSLTAFFVEFLLTGAFIFAIFFLTYRMFQEISVTGDPFVVKYVTTVRAIGILVASMTIAVGLAETIITLVTGDSSLELFTELPGIVVGIIIFCLSYIIDYGCSLKEKSEAN